MKQAKQLSFIGFKGFGAMPSRAMMRRWAVEGAIKGELRMRKELKTSLFRLTGGK
jgi:hypothetical protein